MVKNKHVVVLWALILGSGLVCLATVYGGVGALISGVAMAISGFFLGAYIRRPGEEPARAYNFN